MKVKKFTIKTGITNSIFKSLLFDLKASKIPEITTAKKEGTSPYQANAKLDKMVVTNKRKKGRIQFLSGVLKKVSNA